MSLSDKLKELRINRNWTQDYVADLMKLDRSAISRYETGRSVPNYQTVLQFAQIYRVDKDFLVKELDESLTRYGEPPYILKETLEDQDFSMIRELVQNTPTLKDVLMDLYRYDDRKREMLARSFKALLKELKDW